jgi:glycosyltransferase involved in cell wall biosynthesis
MRILIALTYYRPHYSGLTIYTEREARALADRGHQVTILTSRFDPRLAKHERCDGVEVFRPKVWFHVSKGPIMPSMPIWAWKSIRQADVVHLHVPQFDAAPIALLSKLQRKPVVLTYHCDLHLPSGPVHTIANRVSDCANHVAARAADVIVHNTLDYAEHSPFLRNYLHKLQPVFPPIEIEQVNQSDLLDFRKKCKILPGQRIIGMAARLASEKGVEFLAQALPLVLREFPQARVLFVGPYQDVIGEEEYSRRVTARIRELKDQWSFLGTATSAEMSAFYRTCEVLVLPSINSTESYGMVQVEAMACGTPVIATDLPGIRVPVEKTGAGLVVPPANTEELARALIAVLKDPKRFRGQPDDLVRLSTPEAVALEYERIFNKLLESQQPEKISRVMYDE